jgi:hypothetical protein
MVKGMQSLPAELHFCQDEWCTAVMFVVYSIKPILHLYGAVMVAGIFIESQEHRELTAMAGLLLFVKPAFLLPNRTECST